MTDEEARAALDALIRDRREDYAGLSRLLGRNAAYIQQYVRRGTPRRLAEQDRRTLAAYLEVPDAALGGPAEKRMRVIAAAADPAARAGADLIAVPWLALGASAGPGSLDEDEPAATAMVFPPALLRELGVGRPGALSLIRVRGESMEPTLGDGDDILVDADDGPDRLRDGIYVLRLIDALLVKRITRGPTGTLAVRSDSPHVPDLEDVDPGTLAIVGRVVWASRRIR